jgi:hypothetical protein
MVDVPQQLPISGSNYAALNASTQEILFAEVASANAAQSAANISILSRKNFLPDAALTALAHVSAEKQHEYFFCIAHRSIQDKRRAEINTC